MDLRQHKILGISSLLATMFAAGNAHAALTLLGPDNSTGTGLGAVNTVLTIQSPGNSTFESGSVGLDATGTQTISGDAKTGSSQTSVRSLSSLGLTSASDIRVVFNAAEPGNASANGITLSNLVLNIFSPTGTTLFSSGAFTPVNFSSTTTGLGRSDFVFGLDSAQASAAQSAAFSGSSFGANLIGLTAAASSATGGPETFFVNSGGTAPVPEPSTYILMLSGLAMLGFVGYRRHLKPGASNVIGYPRIAV